MIKSAPPVVTEPVASPVYDSIKRQIESREPGAVVIDFGIVDLPVE